MSYTSIAKLFLKTLDLRAGSIINESEIRALRLYWNRCERGGDAWDQPEWEAFEDAGPWRCSEEHAAKGLKLLRSMLLKKDGSIRHNKFTRDWGEATTLRTLRSLHNPAYFEFHGFDVLGNNRAYYCPMYRLSSTAGEGITYTAVPWQSGDFIFHS